MPRVSQLSSAPKTTRTSVLPDMTPYLSRGFGRFTPRTPSLITPLMPLLSLALRSKSRCASLSRPCSRSAAPRLA